MDNNVKDPAMETRARLREHTFGKGKGSVRAWGGDLCQLLSEEDEDKAVQHRRKATDEGACQMYHACRILSRMRDTVILIHGPRGCAQTLSLYTRFFDGFKMQGKALEYPTRVQCSNLDENDVVFGGADKLRQAILDADQRYHPGFIPIIETCVPGMIGDDMDAVIADVQREVKARLIVFHVPGFRAVNPNDGSEIASRIMVMKAMDPPKTLLRDRVNIWGYESDPRGTKGNQDCDELLRLLEEIGLEGKFFFGGATVEEVRVAPEAILNIAYRPGLMQGLLGEMQTRFGSTCVAGEQPVGTEMTKRWLRAVGRKVGREPDVEDLIERETARIGPQLELHRKKLEGKTVAVNAMMDNLVPILWLVSVDLGMIPTYVGIICYNSYVFQGLKEIQEYLGRNDLKVVINAGKYEDEVIVSQVVKPDVYIASLGYIPKMFTYGQPTVLMNGYQHVGAHMGFNGAVQFAQEIVWAMENPFARKVVPYAGLKPYSSEAWLQRSPLLEGLTVERVTS